MKTAHAYTLMQHTPLNVQLSKEGWAVIRQLMVKSQIEDLLTPVNLIELMMSYILEYRSVGDRPSLLQYTGLYSGCDHDLWSPPEVLVSTQILVPVTPLLIVFKRNALMAALDVRNSSRARGGRPFSPARRMLQVAFHHERNFLLSDDCGHENGSFAPSMIDAHYFALGAGADKACWLEADEQYLAEDIAEGRHELIR